MPKRANTKTIEIAFSDKAFTDHVAAFLYASGHIHDNEELTKLVIDLPKVVPIKYTIKKQGGVKTL